MDHFVSALRALSLTLACNVHAGFERLEDPDPVNSGLFGREVVVAGEWAAVGKPASGQASYPVALYQSCGLGCWTFHSELAPPSQSPRFGRAMAMSEDFLIVGSDEGGMVFERSATDGDPWNPIGQFVTDDKVSAVALAGRVFVVGVSELNVAMVWEIGAGSSGIDTIGTLTDASLAPDAGFGIAVDLNQDFVIVGAFRQTVDGQTDAGQVFVFDNDAPMERLFPLRQTLQTGVASERMGVSVSVDQGRLAVSRYQASIDGMAFSGAVNLYAFDGESGHWVLTAEVSPHDSQSHTIFGRQVLLQGPRLLVSHYRSRVGQRTAAGSLHWFLLTNDGAVRRELRFTAPQVQSGQAFGLGIGLDGDNLLVGAFREHRNGLSDAGAVYAADIEQVLANGFEGLD